MTGLVPFAPDSARQGAFIYASISHWDLVEQPLPDDGGTEPQPTSRQASMAGMT
jgi:hypothetical protein